LVPGRILVHGLKQAREDHDEDEDEHDRARRQDGAGFLAEHVPPYEPEVLHTRLSVPVSVSSSAWSTPLSRWTIRCARPAAFGSCVTMTIVLPNSSLRRLSRVRI